MTTAAEREQDEAGCAGFITRKFGVGDVIQEPRKLIARAVGAAPVAWTTPPACARGLADGAGDALLNQKASMLTGLRRELSDPKGTAASIRRLVIEHGSVHWPRYLLSFGYMAVTAFCTSAVAYLVGYGADQSYVHRSLQGAALAWLLFTVAFVLGGVATYGRAVTLARIGNHIVADYQRRMFDKLIRQDVAFFGNRHSSEFAARVSFGASSPAQVLDLLINALGRDLLTLVSLTCLMVAKAPIPSAIALLVVPSAVLGVRRVKKFRDIALAQFVGGAEIHKVIQELVQGFRIVKAFNLEEIVRAEAHNGIAAIERAANKHASISNGLTPLIDLMTGIVVGLMFLYGGYRILVLGAAPGEFLSFVSAFLLAAEPAKRIARLNFELQGALFGVQVLFDVLDLPDAGEATPKGDAKVERGRIEFDRVSFAYRADNPVLREVSFVAQPGEVTAFVGASGGGKSTIFNLVLAFYAPERGSIQLDGEDYRELSADSIRRQIAYVGQDVFLFHGTIGYNIGLGRSGATEAEIVDAARAAHAHAFISQFPGGYATPVGELGAQMSGGQRQRIAIARALIRNAPIILLDEPTAALDTESEGFVREAMAALIKGRTTLVIAHRLYTITQADMIHVVEGGTIVESGRHAELLARQGRYAQLSRLRFGPGSAERNGLQTKVSIISA